MKATLNWFKQYVDLNWSPERIGCVFDFGIECISMLRYGINDIRLFYEYDERFLKQF